MKIVILDTPTKTKDIYEADIVLEPIQIIRSHRRYNSFVPLEECNSNPQPYFLVLKHRWGHNNQIISRNSLGQFIKATTDEHLG